MTEFVNRMALQRHILRVVNQRTWSENLFGLSLSAITRWQIVNRIRPDGIELELVMVASRALSFLATKSQDQISDEYGRRCEEARVAARKLGEHFQWTRQPD